MTSTGKFWAGSISTSANAERIIAWTVGVFGVFGVLVLLTAFYPYFAVSKLLVPLVILVPVGILWRARAVAAAGALVGLSGFSVLASLGGAIFAVAYGHDPSLFIPIALFWILPLALAWRSFKATKFLSSNSPLQATG